MSENEEMEVNQDVMDAAAEQVEAREAKLEGAAEQAEAQETLNRQEAESFVSGLEGEGGKERAQEAHEDFEARAQSAREKVETLLKGAKMAKEGLHKLTERFESIDLTDEALNEKGVADVITGALEEHFSADMDELMSATEGMSPAFFAASFMRDAYRSVMADSDEETAAARKSVWKKSAKVNPLIAMADWGHNVWGAATKEGEERQAHVDDMKETLASNSWLAKMFLQDNGDVIKEQRIRAQVSSDVLAVLAPFSMGLGPEVAAAVKIGKVGMEKYTEKLQGLETRIDAGEEISKGDVLSELTKASVEIVDKDPAELIKLAAEAALASGGIENEAGLMALELLKAKPEIGVAALHKLDSAITTDRAAA